MRVQATVSFMTPMYNKKKKKKKKNKKVYCVIIIIIIIICVLIEIVGCGGNRDKRTD